MAAAALADYKRFQRYSGIGRGFHTGLEKNGHLRARMVGTGPPLSSFDDVLDAVNKSTFKTPVIFNVPLPCGSSDGHALLFAPR